MKALLILTALATLAVGHQYSNARQSRQAAAPGGPLAAQNTRRVRAEGQLGPGAGTLVIELKAPKGGRLTEGAPLSISGSAADIQITPVKHKLEAAKLPVRVPLQVADGATGPVQIHISFYWCRDQKHAQVVEGSAACSPEKGSVTVDLDLTGDAPGGEAFFRYEAR